MRDLTEGVLDDVDEALAERTDDAANRAEATGDSWAEALQQILRETRQE